MNSSTVASKCRYRRALWFAKGHIPVGYVPVIQGTTIIQAQFDERKTWSDGSLQLCVMSMMDNDFAGSESRTYSISAATGSYNNGGLRALADVTGSHAFKVAFSNVAQSDGTNTTTRGSGGFSASFNAQAVYATRVYNYHSGPVCSSWEVWGMALDNSGGTQDNHLKTVWYVTAWNNPDGTLNDVEYGAVVSQDWWNVAGKTCLNYNAALMDGSATINSYASVSHPYHAQWMTVRTANDNNHARRFWANAIPTLYHTFDKNYARATGLFPYLDPIYQPNSIAAIVQGGGGNPPSNYTPCSAQDHRAQIDGTGGYPGRGLMTNYDCVAWMRQTAADYRYARTNGFAGLHVPYHYHAAATRTITAGPRAGTDVANTVVSMIMRPLSASAYDFTAQGMPAPIDAYTWGISAPVSSTFVTPTGGTGVWTTSVDASHAVAYSYGMYLLEGERHFMQATLDLGTNACHQLNGNNYAGAPTAMYYQLAPFQTLLNIPGTQYSGIANQRPEVGNYRNVGWGMNLVAQARVVCPDADVQSGFIKIFQSQQAAYQVFNLSYYPPGQLAIGSLNAMMPGKYIDSPWMGNFDVLGYAFAAIACEDANALTVLNSCLQFNCLTPWAYNQPYRSKDYRDCPVLYAQANYDATTNPLLAPQNNLEQVTVTVANNTATLPANIVTPTNGDPVYFLTIDDSFNTVPVPPGTIEGTKYYAVNCTATTLQVASSPGGSPLALGPGSDYSIGLQPANWAVASAAANGQPTVYSDDYPPISNAALIMAAKAGASAVTSAMVSTAAAFLQPVDFSQYAAWKLTA